MKKFFALLKVSVKSMLLSSTNSQGGSRKRAATGVGAMVLIAFLGLYMSGFYSWMLMDVLAPVHMEVLVFIFMGMGALVGGLLFTTFAVKGVVFGGRDNDLLLSMPVSSTMLMASRVSAIYLENLLFSLFVLGPAGAVCAFMTQSGVGHSALFWVRLVVAVFALPCWTRHCLCCLGPWWPFCPPGCPRAPWARISSWPSTWRQCSISPSTSTA